MSIKIGTRGSKLALWQAYHVQNLLLKAGVESEICIVETKGDRILDVTLSKIGSKGIFTQELEEKLISGEIDIAVHSAKDVQSTLPAGLRLIAFMEREKSHDVVISLNPNFDLNNKAHNPVVGTSSTRRVAMLKHFYPHVSIVDMRGNLQTRLEKLSLGACDAMLLAYAGVHRMNFEQYIVQHLPVSQFTPPVGQGSIAIECAELLSTDKQNVIKNILNHSETEICLLTERAFLKQMDGGCSIPTFALANLINSTLLQIHGGIISLDGQQIVQNTQLGLHSKAILLGESLAKNILENGGAQILKEIKNIA